MQELDKNYRAYLFSPTVLPPTHPFLPGVPPNVRTMPPNRCRAQLMWPVGGAARLAVGRPTLSQPYFPFIIIEKPKNHGKTLALHIEGGPQSPPQRALRGPCLTCQASSDWWNTGSIILIGELGVRCSCDHRFKPCVSQIEWTSRPKALGGGGGGAGGTGRRGPEPWPAGVGLEQSHTAGRVR